MALNKEHSRDKTEWVKWPHLENHWRPQHYETPHRASKKSDNSRSHSWWWDSHISPKSSKWLQENLAEMDSKVSAMLKIIEEDADSFAKRAEMYYKRRPELINLAEEFYRTYRALVERHTFLTKELRQNIAPALHAHLTGAAYEPPFKIPTDPPVKHGSDGFDIASLSSYSFSGALESEEDSQSEFSAKSLKGPVDEEDVSPRSSRVSFETREFGFQPFGLSSEEEHVPLQQQNKTVDGYEGENSSMELRKTAQILEDEKEALIVKSGEDEIKLKDLRLEVSSLLSKTKALEAEEKLAKDRLHELLQLKQTLEAENLKLSHALIASKEEKTQMTEARDQSLQEVLASGRRIHELEEEIAFLQRKTAASHAEVLFGQEQVKRLEDESKKLQHSLVATQDRNQRDALASKETFEKRLEGLHRQIIDLEEDNGCLKEQGAAQSVQLQELKQRAMEVGATNIQLEQDLLKLQKSKEAIDLENSTMVVKIEGLGRELEATQRREQELLEHIMQKDGQMSKLELTLGNVEEHRTRLEAEKDEMLKYTLRLEAESKELQRARDSVLVQSQQHESQCQALEAAHAQLNKQVESLLNNNTSLQKEKMSVESMLVKAKSEVKELHGSLSAMLSEKILLLEKASHNIDASHNENDESSQELVLQTAHFRDLELALSRLLQENDMLGKREAKALISFSDLEKASQAQTEKFKQILNEHLALIAERDVSLTNLVKQKDFLENQGREALQSNSRLKKELSLLKTERMEGSKLAERLQAEVKDLKNAQEHTFAECQRCEEECKALKEAEEELKVLLAAKQAEGSSLQKDKAALGGELAKLSLQTQELHTNMSDLSSQKAALRLELDEALERIRIVNAECGRWQGKAEECEAEISMLRNEAVVKAEFTSKLENEVETQSMGIQKLEEEIALFQIERNNVTSKMAEYEVKVHDLEAKASESLAAQTALNEEAAHKSHTIERLKMELAGICKENDALCEKFAVCSAHASLLQNQVAKCREVEDLQHVNLQKHADTIRSMEIEIENLKLSVSEAEERNNALICEQQKSLDENSCMHRKIQDLEEQARHFAEDKELVIKGHEEQNEKLQMQLQSSSGIIQSMEAELVKLHKAVSPAEEANLISGCQQSRSFDAGFIMPDRITHIHQKVGGLLEERALLVSRVSYHIEQRDEMELRLHSLERDKDNLLDKLKNEQQVAFEAKRNIEKLEGELSQLREVNAKVENELRMKSMDLSAAQEEALGAKARNDILEAEVQQHLHEINILNEDVERLGHQLQDAQQEIKGLEENLSLSASKCSDAEKAACDARQETSKHIADGESLRHRMAVLLADVSKLQQDTTDVKEEKRILFCKVEALQLELDRSHSEREQLMLQMKDRTSELDERRVKVENLQQQLDAVQSGHSLLTENFSEAKNQWTIEQVELQEMLAHHKAASLEGQKNLEAQLESENKLKRELFHMQQDNKQLEELLSQAVNKHMDAEKAIMDAKEELNKHIANRDLQNSEMVVAASNIGKLEHDLAGLQDEKQSLLANLEATQLEMSQVQGENKHLMSQVGAVTVQLQGKESEIQKLQEQLQGAESNNCSLVEALSSMKLSWGAEQERLQGELAQLTATNLEGQKDLAIQLDCVSKLMDELTGLHSERSHLQEDRDLHAKRLADQLNQIEDARKREHDKDAEVFELSALAEALKHSLLAKDTENLKLREELSKSDQCQIESEKKLMDEISFLQSEEMRWRNEVTTNSALMAEKVACLRMENAALHEDLSSKLELLLKLEKDLELLREERSSLFQALQAMASEMQEYKNDLQIFKEAVIPSLEERAGELQDEITDLTISIESHVAEIKILQKQLKDATGELLRLHDENATSKIELTFNVEMLKHVDGVSSLIKAENLRLFDKLGLQEQHSQMQGQLLATASSENEGLSRRLVLATEERNGLKTELQSLISVVTEVEQLQRELAAAREDHGSVRRTEPSCIQKVVTSLSNSDGGSMDASESIHAHTHGVKNEHTNTKESVEAQMHKVKLGMVDLEHGEKAFPPESQQSMESLPLAGVKDESMSDLGASEEGSDGKLTVATSSHALLIGSLKEEILYLQEEIQKLQLATGGQGPGIASNEGAARDLRSPSKSSTASSSSILTIEEAQETLDDVQRLKDENCDLVEEINSLKSQSLAAWMENNLVEDLVKQLQANLALSQEQNGHLCSEISACKELIGNLEEESHSLQQENEHLGLEVSSCKVDIARLGGECHSLQAKNAELQENLKASAQEKQKSEDALHMLEDVITSLERNNRRLQAENESANMEMKKLNSSISCLHDDGSELIALIKAKMMAVLEQVKLTMNECQRETGDEGIVQIIEDVEHVSSSPPGRANASFPADEHSKATMESADHKRAQDAMTELEARNMLILTELQARAEETNSLLELVVFIRKMLIRFLGGEHTCQRDAPLSNLEGEEGSSLADRSMAVVCDEHHIKLAERLHQALMDERLEHEVLELNEGRKQLKEELEARLAEVQRMESELEKFQVFLEHNERSKERERVVDIEEKRRNTRAEESAKELRDMLAQQRRRLGRMQEEVMFGDEQQEAAVENRVTVLVSTESTASMEGWDDEQVNLLSRELESLRGLNRRHSAELQTISQDLQSMGSIIKEAQDQLLLAGSSQDDEEEIISMADLRTQKSSIIDLRTPVRRISGDSTQQLLSPSPRIEGGDADVVLQSRSEGGTGQFGLKPRNFGFTWFLLLFSPDRKAGGLARSRSNKRWAALKPIWRSGSDSTALVVERERRKAAGCWACVSNTSRLDSFDGR